VAQTRWKFRCGRGNRRLTHDVLLLQSAKAIPIVSVKEETRQWYQGFYTLTVLPGSESREHDYPIANFAEPGQASLEKPSVPGLVDLLEHAVLESAAAILLLSSFH
jgi:hypothetical protein